MSGDYCEDGWMDGESSSATVRGVPMMSALLLFDPG